MYKFAVFLAPLFFLNTISTPVIAQASDIPPGPIYVVQEGDTLWDISILFNVSVTDLIEYNNLLGQDIFVGDKLVIPGLEDLSGTLVIHPIQLGESLRSISRQNNVDVATLVQLNHLVSPSELFAGHELILLKNDELSTTQNRTTLLPGETLLDLAVLQNTQRWNMARSNELDRPSISLPGDVFAIADGQSFSPLTSFPLGISSLQMDPLPIIQGSTVQIRVDTESAVTVTGYLVDMPLHFFSIGNNSQVALQGIYAMLDPGIYPFHLSVTLPDGNSEVFEQLVLVKSGNFTSETLYVDEGLIDPAVTEPEFQWLLSVVTPITPEKLWQGIFQLPVASDSYCLRSGFGNRRAYNNSELFSFHTGLDFGICSETHPFDIYSPAAGTVVFVGEKSVRGNATIINHGWGIYSGMWHQEEMYVAVGDQVEAGQTIGTIGFTGRVTGPHLHWEVWVSGVQVNPLDWLENKFPHEQP